MKSICFLGECMVELKDLNASQLKRAFAGDMYNSAVYLKRCYNQYQVSMVTAIGRERFSEQMLDAFKQEHIDTQFVFRHPDKHAGIYHIETDDTGERTFAYWRNDSAAKHVMDFIDPTTAQTLAASDWLVVSGISLAILPQAQREQLWQLIQTLKKLGGKLLFDPNYRPALWPSPSDAKQQFDTALSQADLVLPGVEDLAPLYGTQTSEQVLELCKTHKVPEIVVKNGAKSVISHHQNQTLSHKITPANHVVDTTSAGDAFNGVYLGARLSGQSISEAVNIASHAAKAVIQYPGAIAPREAFLELVGRFRG